MIQSQSSNIKSGWKNIFAAFTLAASDEEGIVALSFQNAERVTTFMIEEKRLFVDCFQDCVKCLAEFACNQVHLDISMDAIHKIR